MSAIQLKDQGNKAFLSKDYDKAIELYSSAIKLDNYNPILYSNRAQCYLNLKKFELAYNDCIKGLNLPNNNNNIQILIKLNFRKAMALKGLLKFKLAKESFEKILKLDPLNNAAILEIKNLPQENNNNNTDIDINIPIEEVNELPQDFINILKPPVKKISNIEPIEIKTTSSEVDKEIDNLFGSKKSNEKSSIISESFKKIHPSNENVLLSEKLPMHFLTALKQLPDSKKINGYKYILNLDATSYQVIFESGIDAEFLLFFLDAVNYVSTNDSIANWNTIVLNHLKQFSRFKRYNLTILMCDDSVKKSILHNVEQQYPGDLQNFKKYIYK